MTKEELNDWVFDKFPVCGCGESGMVLGKLRDLLRYYAIDNGARDYSDLEKLIGPTSHGFPSTADGWLWIYLLDHLGLTEHGNNVACQWASSFGKDVLAALEEHGTEPNAWDCQ